MNTRVSILARVSTQKVSCSQLAMEKVVGDVHKIEERSVGQIEDVLHGCGEQSGEQRPSSSWWCWFCQEPVPPP